MRLPIAPSAMRRPIQNARANPSGCRSPSSRQSSGLWTKGLPRYGVPLAFAIRLQLLTAYQRLGHQPCAPAYPQGFRKPHLHSQTSALRIPCFTAQLRYIHAVLGSTANSAHLCHHATVTNCRSTCGAQAGYRCRLACISSSLPGSTGLLLQSDRGEATQ
jgi:hypothetical protein